MRQKNLFLCQLCVFNQRKKIFELILVTFRCVTLLIKIVNENNVFIVIIQATSKIN